MRTLDSLPRSDLLNVLKNIINLHGEIAANHQAAQETDANIRCAYNNYNQMTKRPVYKSIKRTIGIVLLVIWFIYFPILLPMFRESVEALTLPNGASIRNSFGIPDKLYVFVVLLVLAGVFVGTIALSIALLKRGQNEIQELTKKRIEYENSEGYKRALSQEYNRANAYVAEQKKLLSIYSEALGKAKKDLNNNYFYYCVRSEMQNLQAIRYCYKEIYSSSNTSINAAFQHFLEKEHREEMLFLQQEQNEAIEFARREAAANAKEIIAATERANNLQKEENRLLEKGNALQEETIATMRRGGY